MHSQSPHHDVIIVGAGPAGCVLAARLTEDTARSVLLIEAGPDYGPDAAGWPAELVTFAGTLRDSHSWGYRDQPDEHGLRMPIPRARLVGGCSAVNGCVWLRGSRADYDGWAALGNPGWGFDDLLPAFRRAEHDPTGDGRLHGHAGPVPVRRAGDDELSAVDWAMIDTAPRLGFPYRDDLNGAEDQSPAVGRTPKNASGGVRHNAAFTHLALAQPRPNFTLRADTLIDRVLVNGRTVRGVRAVNGDELLARDVILAAGAYNTPLLLLRSGIGPAPDLHRLGITPVLDRPGVGAHLLDHPVLMRDFRLNQFVIAPDHTPPRPSFGQTIVVARSRQVDAEIDLHLTPVVEFNAEHGVWTLLVGISLQYARSRGRLQLSGPDPEAPPAIDLNYFADPADLEALVDGVELMQRFVATPPLAGMLAGPLDPADQTSDRDALRALVRARSQTTHHPSSTCRMGPAPDPLTVVDARGRVHGLERLWIADASIFPTGPRANIHWATVAVAERIAELFRRERPVDAVVRRGAGHDNGSRKNPPSA